MFRSLVRVRCQLQSCFFFRCCSNKPELEHKLTIRWGRRMNENLVDLAKVYVLQNKVENVLKLLFKYPVNGKQQCLIFMRQADAVLSDTLERIRLKINCAEMKRLAKAAPSDDQQLNVGLLTTDEISVKDSAGSTLHTGVTNEAAFVTTGKSLSIQGHHYDILLDVPYVQKLRLPSKMFATLPLFPSVSLENTVADQCKFMWFVQSPTSPQPPRAQKNLNIAFDPKTLRCDIPTWTLRCEERLFVPSVEDVGKRVSLICVPSSERGSAGLPYSQLALGTVEAAPPSLIFEDRLRMCASPCTGDRFRFVSYNILADLYLDLKVDSEQLFFSYCPVEYQNLSYRLPLLLKEFAGYHADLYCLQEVDAKSYSSLFEPYFRYLGLGSTFVRKGADVAEGLVTVYNERKFRFLYSDSVVLADLLKDDRPEYSAVLTPLLKQREDVEVMSSRPQVLQTSFFQLCEYENEFLCVSNVHLHSKATHSHVRIWQTALCMAHISRAAESFKLEHPKCGLAVIFAGDMNSLLDSAVHRLLKSGSVTADEVEWGTTSPGCDIQVPFRLQCISDTGSFTNITQNFRACLDYIYANEKVKVERNVPAPPPELATMYTGLPSRIAPSDHLPLICEFSLKVAS